MRWRKYSIRSGDLISGALTEDMMKAAMPEGSMLLIDGDGRGIAVNCSEGAACLTQMCDPEDHILHPGKTFIIDRKGLVAVTALASAQISIFLPDRMPTES